MAYQDVLLDIHADLRCDNQAAAFAKIRSEGFVYFNTTDTEGNTILHIAAEKGYKVIALEILKHLCVRDVDAVNSKGDTALHICARLGHVSIAARILDFPGLNVNLKGFEGRTALNVAVVGGHVEIVKEILAIENVNVNVVDDNHCTPVQLAQNNASISLLLMEHRSVNWDQYLECRKLHRAIRCEVESEVVDLVARSHMMLHTCDFFGTTTLHIAIEHGKNDVVKAILERHDVSVNGKDFEQNTPLHLASSSGDVDTVRALLAREDVDLNSKNCDQLTPLELAISRGNNGVVKAFEDNRGVQHGDCLDLHANVRKDSRAAVFAKILSKGFVYLDARDAGENTILHIAAEEDNREIAFQIVKQLREADVNAVNKMGDTALHICAKLGRVSIAASILDCPGLNVNRKGCAGRTALHVAVDNGHLEIVKEILAIEDVDVNVVDERGHTPVELAQNNALISLLLRERRSVNWVQYLECRKLHRAIRCGVESDVVDLMAGSDAKLHSCDFFGTTTLHVAAEHWKENIVQAILKRDDVNVNAKDYEQNTPLHIACRNGDEDTTRVIIARKDVDENAKNYLNYTPLEYAAHVSNARKAVARKAMAVNAKDSRRHNTLRLAISEGNCDIIEAIVKTPGALEHEDLLLHFAINCGGENKIPTLRKLLGFEGVRLFEEDKNGQTAFELAFIEKSQEVVKVFMEQPTVKDYVESLYRDRQVYVDAANAILVGAALIASVAFASWLQPPLGYSTYYGESYVEPLASPPISYPQYASIHRHKPLEAFWVFNSFSFFFAIATVVFGARSVLPNRKTFIKHAVRKIRQNLLITSVLLSISVMFVLVTFVLAGYAVLPPIMKFQANIIGTAVTGGIVCLVSLFFLAKSIYDEWTAQ